MREASGLPVAVVLLHLRVLQNQVQTPDRIQGPPAPVPSSHLPASSARTLVLLGLGTGFVELWYSGPGCGVLAGRHVCVSRLPLEEM